MSSFLREAFKGAKADIESAGTGVWPRLGRTLRVARILGAELAAIVALAPYGAYAMSVYRRLPGLLVPELLPQGEQPPSQAGEPTPDPTSPLPQPPSAPPDLVPTIRATPPGRDGVAVHRKVPYGPALRNTLDVYVPVLPALSTRPPAPSPTPADGGGEGGGGAGSGGLLPVVFFLHGGVWSTGETWQYAPMATRLAQAGMVVVVPTYTLYPEALTGTMVEEVSAALSWTFDNVRRYGGDPGNVVANGHSAGGHLLAWALLRRAAAAEQAAASAAAAAALSVRPAPAPAPAWLPSAPSPAASAGGADAVPATGLSSPGAHRGTGAVEASSSPASHGPQPEPSQGLSQHPAHQQQQDTVRLQEQQQQQQRLWRQERREELEEQGSGAHGGDRRETGAYLLGGGGASLPGAMHALGAVVDAQLHPRPGVDTSYASYDEAGGAAATAAAAAARPVHPEVDTRMPRVFVGMSGVYDMGKHYEFEKARGVHEMSMLKRAMGGPAGFTAASPTAILAAAADGASAATRDGSASSAAAAPDGQLPSYYKSFELLGDAIPARAGLTDPWDGLLGPGPTAAPSQGQPWSGGVAAGADVAGSGVPDPGFTLAAARRLPPFVIMGSCADHMVPWHEGAELVLQLRRCGVPVRHLLYNHIAHGDFVMPWRPLDLGALAEDAAQEAQGQEGQQQQQAGEREGGPATAPGRELRGLLPCGKDFLRIALGMVEPVPGGRRHAAGVERTREAGDDSAASTQAAEEREVVGATRSRL